MHRRVRLESLPASFHLLLSWISRAALSKDSLLSTRQAIAFSARHLLPLSTSFFTVCEHFSTAHVYVCWILTLGVEWIWSGAMASCLLENVTLFLCFFLLFFSFVFVLLSFLMSLVVMVKAITHLVQQ